MSATSCACWARCGEAVGRGSEGDFKLYGKARDVQEAATRASYRAAVRARIDWEPTDPFHLFAIEIESAAYVTFTGERFSLVWDPNGGTRRRSQRLE